jgi:hypothetical protein
LNGGFRLTYSYVKLNQNQQPLDSPSVVVEATFSTGTLTSLVTWLYNGETGKFSVHFDDLASMQLDVINIRQSMERFPGGKERPTSLALSEQNAFDLLNFIAIVATRQVKRPSSIPAR